MQLKTKTVALRAFEHEECTRQEHQTQHTSGMTIEFDDKLHPTTTQPSFISEKVISSGELFCGILVTCYRGCRRSRVTGCREVCHIAVAPLGLLDPLGMSPGARNDRPRQTRRRDLHPLRRHGYDAATPREFCLLIEQDTTMTFEPLLSLCEDGVPTRMSSASQGIAFTTKQNDDKLLVVNTHVIDKRVHTMLLAWASR